MIWVFPHFWMSKCTFLTLQWKLQRPVSIIQTHCWYSKIHDDKALWVVNLLVVGMYKVQGQNRKFKKMSYIPDHVEPSYPLTILISLVLYIGDEHTFTTINWFRDRACCLCRKVICAFFDKMAGNLTYLRLRYMNNGLMKRQIVILFANDIFLFESHEGCRDIVYGRWVCNEFIVTQTLNSSIW